MANSNRNGDTPTSARDTRAGAVSTVNSNDVGRRGDGASGTISIPSSSHNRESAAGSQPASSGNTTNPPTSVAIETWRKIGDNFVRNRNTSRHQAFKQMQLEIMQNCAILCPDYFTPKEIVAMAMEVEVFLKDNPEATGEDKSNLDLFSEFLRGDEISTIMSNEGSNVTRIV